MRILVVEDDGLIAVDVAEVLQHAGAIVVGPYTRLGEGLKAAVDEAFDVALLDVNLDGKPSWPIATLIGEIGIPVVLATGYSDHFERPASLASLPSVSKPYDTPALLNGLREAIGSRPGKFATDGARQPPSTLEA